MPSSSAAQIYVLETMRISKMVTSAKHQAKSALRDIRYFDARTKRPDICAHARSRLAQVRGLVVYRKCLSAEVQRLLLLFTCISFFNNKTSACCNNQLWTNLQCSIKVSWSNGYDVSLTPKRFPVRSRAGLRTLASLLLFYSQ